MWHAKPVGPVLTVRAMVAVTGVSVPEVPVMMTVEAPAVAVALALKVTTLLPVAGLVANAAVTPLGRPDAASVTLPVNPPTSVTVMVSVAVMPWVIERLAGDAARVKPGVDFVVTVRPMEADAVRLPEVPVTATVAAPTVAVLLAVSVSTQLPLPVMGVLQPETVTPLIEVGKVMVTVPVNPPWSVTVMVSVALPPCAIDRVAGEAESVKLPVCEGPMVSAMVVVAGVNAPEVPVMVTVALP